MSIVRLLRTSAFFLASMAIAPRRDAQELRLYAEAGGGPSLGSFAEVSPAAYGAALGLEAAGLFGSGLGLGLELGYESFPPEADWIESLGRFRALALGGLEAHVNFVGRSHCVSETIPRRVGRPSPTHDSTGRCLCRNLARRAPARR